MLAQKCIMEADENDGLANQLIAAAAAAAAITAKHAEVAAKVAAKQQANNSGGGKNIALTIKRPKAKKASKMSSVGRVFSPDGAREAAFGGLGWKRARSLHFLLNCSAGSDAPRVKITEVCLEGLLRLTRPVFNQGVQRVGEVPGTTLAQQLSYAVNLMTALLRY